MKHFRLALALVLVPTLAHAHPGHGDGTGGIGWGVAHPFSGLDHILAMIAVGLWAVQGGRRALWALPLAFVCSMAAGTALGLGGVRLPLVEPMILAGLLCLGAMTAMAVRLPIVAAAALTAGIAFFHGQAHGSEMPGGAGGFAAAAGLAFSTALLHTSGIVAGLALQRLAEHRGIRAAGAAIFCAAVLLTAGVL